MAILDKFKYEIDTPGWRQMSPVETAHAAGSLLCCDKRNDQQCDHGLWNIASATTLHKWNARYNGNILVGSPALAAFAAGGEAVFVPSMGVSGTIGVGSTTTKIITATATVLGSAIAAVGLNQFVTTDTDYGYHIRIINKVTGKTEERFIRGNTASATPTIYLDGPLLNAPNNGDLFEIQAGGVFMIAATTTAVGQSRHYSLATNAFANAGAIGVTTATAASMVALDELYVPYNRKTGEGFLIGASTYDSSYTSAINGEVIDESKGCLLATAAAATSITGQATAGDAAVLANEYRNFQIRIVEDTTNVTAVGQRRIIQSHTAGASAVYTVATWTVTPSASAKFVIENPNLILLQSAAQAGMLTYNYNTYTVTNATPTTITAFTWSSTYFNATHTAAVAAGTMAFPCYGHQPQTQTDGSRLSRHSYVWFFRGGATTLDRFDMAGAANGLWSDNVTYSGTTTTFTAGTCGDYDPVTFLGEYAYINLNGTNLMLQFNVSAASLVPWVKAPLQSGTAAVGRRICVTSHVADRNSVSDDKLAMIYLQTHLGTIMYRSDITG
jgi:hypothetical protein